MSTRPLADEIRPQRLDEVVGQRHLIGPGGVLRRLIDAGTSANMIFYGPSGTGKTTIANIIANKTNKTLYRLNATTASLQDVKDIIASVGTLMAPGGILLYLDEIQYFNKKQQQSLLEFMENGSITLIASTTENPFFYVYNALLSRSLGAKQQEQVDRAANTGIFLFGCTYVLFALIGAFLSRPFFLAQTHDAEIVGYGVDYANLGVETANMVSGILLDGSKPSATPVLTFDNGTATINTDICRELGLNYDELAEAFAPLCTKVQSIVTAESFDDLNE